MAYSSLAGADIVLHGLETMFAEFGERLRPAPFLKNMVRSGDCGRKTGRGFYDYTQKWASLSPESGRGGFCRIYEEGYGRW
jgi:3-hydroxyacyl-CoA dehydrogenase